MINTTSAPQDARRNLRSKLISIEEDSINESDAEQLIEICKKYHKQKKDIPHRDMYGLHVLDSCYNKSLSDYDLSFCETQFDNIIRRTNELTNRKHYIDRAILSYWPTDSRQVFHWDNARPNTDYTSVTFLNDNYIGGKQIVLEDGNVMIQCTPKLGRTIRLDGKNYAHSVTPIEMGARYTMTIWYTLQSAFSIYNIDDPPRRNNT